MDEEYEGLRLADGKTLEHPNYRKEHCHGYVRNLQ